ncbi:MAG: hypothetical protein JXA30_17225, partial [Deltaproteobacteria bacterium]|nr:hypothetical protein [Deltaproteobacteria bacterium]
EPARGRKPVLRDESAAVVAKQQYPPEQLRNRYSVTAKSQRPDVSIADRLAVNIEIDAPFL